MRKCSYAYLGTGIIGLLLAVSTLGCPPTTATLRVDNTTGKSITAVYCTPTTSDTWGENLIVGAIAPGQYLDIPRFLPGAYDILAVFADGSEVQKNNATFVVGQTYSWNVLLSIPSGKSDDAPLE